jgi:hypothetical protein
MTPRPLARTRRAVACLVLAAGLLTLAGGCDPRALFYFLQPFEPTIAAPGPSLKGKKVVVLCQAAAGTRADFESLDHELSRELIKILKANVKRIQVVDLPKVEAWMQAHPSLTNPAEAVDAFEADVAVFLDVESFQIQSPSSPDLYEGKSKIHIKVYEYQHPKDTRGREQSKKPRELEMVYDEYQDSAFPLRGPLPTEAGVSRSSFKNKFLKLVASEVSWHFVEHAPGDNIQDVKFSE